MKKLDRLNAGNIGGQLLRRTDAALRKLGGKYYRKTLGQLKYRLRFGNCRLDPRPGEACQELSDLTWTYELPVTAAVPPLVSIICREPEDLQDKERLLQAIQSQTYSRTEVIWVKDQDPVRCWNAGIRQARGKYIWLLLECFSCREDYLERMVSLLQYSSVMLAIDTPLPGNDVSAAPFYVSGYDFSHNKISSQLPFDSSRMLFRNAGGIPEKLVSAAEKEGIPSELLLPLFCMQGGLVACADCHMDVAGGGAAESPAETFTAEQVGQCLELLHRRPNIVIAAYALKAGGGETFPIYLCNELKKYGGSVTLLNCNLEEQEEGIADLADSAVPIVNIRHTDCIGNVLLHLGCEIIHSHHAVVDYAVARWCKKYPDLGKHVITLHGMYETIAEEDCSRTISATWAECSKYVYIADKNLDCFKQRGKYKAERFVKLPNGLPEIAVTPVERKKLGIAESAFVLVLASRAIPEKGWMEAIEAVETANRESAAEIHLVLLGDGPCRKQIEGWVPDYIHVMGTVSNVRDYFAMGDAGVLPSYYKGESFPLVVIECLMCGRPVIATGLGEVPGMLQDAAGEPAGILVGMKDGHADPQELAGAILTLAEQREVYREMQERTISLSQRFTIDAVAEKYMELYEEIR